MILSLSVLLVGCTPAPPELQGLRPVTVTVLKEEQPVAGVLVSLTNKVPQGPWSSSALTDSRGIAVIRTSIRTLIADGAKPGEYVISLDKSAALPGDLIPDDTESSLPENVQIARQKKRDEFVEQHRVIPKKFESSRTSPIELTVDEKTGAKLVVDLSKY